MKGKKGKHTIRDWLRQRGLAATARNISSAGVYASAVHADADVSALQQSLQIYWQTNQVGEGVFPEECLLQFGSRIQLWAPGTHANIGFAYGHPDMDGRACQVNFALTVMTKVVSMPAFMPFYGGRTCAAMPVGINRMETGIKQVVLREVQRCRQPHGRG